MRGKARGEAAMKSTRQAPRNPRKNNNELANYNAESVAEAISSSMAAMEIGKCQTILCLLYGSIFVWLHGLHLLHLPEKAPEAAKPKGREVSTEAPTKVCFCDSYYVLFFRVKDFSRTHVHVTFSFQLKKQTLVLNYDDDDDVL